MNLLYVEMRRSMRRRATWVMLGLGSICWVVAGVIAYLSSRSTSVAELRGGEPHPAVMTDWWTVGDADNALMIAATFLLIGGFMAGAAVAGGEWRAGTITTVLTWEARRVRLGLSRIAACGILAFVLALVLEVLFFCCLLPAVLANGSTTGTDAAWWTSFGWAVGRVALLTAVTAMAGAAIAHIGRNTAFALAVAFAWVVVVEQVVRAQWPTSARFLMIENLATALTWEQMRSVEFTRGPALSLGTLLGSTAVIVVVALVTFRRRDIASTS